MSYSALTANTALSQVSLAVSRVPLVSPKSADSNQSLLASCGIRRTYADLKFRLLVSIHLADFWKNYLSESLLLETTHSNGRTIFLWKPLLGRDERSPLRPRNQNNFPREMPLDERCPRLRPRRAIAWDLSQQFRRSKVYCLFAQ